MYEGLSAKKKVICQRSGHLLPQQIPWPKCVSSSQQLESAGPQIFVLVKVGPITIGQLIRYIGSQKQFNQTDLLFHSPTKKEDQI
jgi:hypothetical protein